MSRKVNLINVAFKPEAKQSDIEKVLAQYAHIKVFDNTELGHDGSREEQILARLYHFVVPTNGENEIIKELESKYGGIIEYAKKPAQRRLIK